MSAKTARKKRMRERKDVQISTVFQPRFWNEADGRCAVVKAIRKLVEQYKEDSGADSVMKHVLCERAAFLTVQLASFELDAADGKEYPAGVYTQMNNALIGILKTLGLEKKAPNAIDLKTVLAEGRKR